MGGKKRTRTTGAITLTECTDVVSEAWLQFPQFPFTPELAESFYKDLQGFTRLQVEEAITSLKNRGSRAFPINATEIIGVIRAKGGNSALTLFRGGKDPVEDPETTRRTIETTWANARPEIRDLFGK